MRFDLSIIPLAFACPHPAESMSLSRRRDSPPTAVTGGLQNPTPVSRRGISVELEALDKYDRLRHSPQAASVRGSQQLVRVPAEEGSGVPNFDLRHLSVFLALTSSARSDPSKGSAMAAMMAVHHWNSNVSDVVPELAEARRSCPRLRFTMELFDTRHSPIVAARYLTEELFPRRERRDPTEPVPTAIVGSSTSSVSATMAALTGLAVPQVSHAATSTAFDYEDQYPLFGRIVPSVKWEAQAAVDYLTKTLGATHFNVLFVRDAYGTSYSAALQEAARTSDPPIKVAMASFSIEGGDDAEIASALNRLKQTKYRYFVAIMFRTRFERVMEEAYRRGLTGNDYFWMYGDGILPRESEFQVSTTDIQSQTLNGAAIISIAYPAIFKGQSGHDAFVDHFEQMLRTEEAQLYLDSKIEEHKGLDDLFAGDPFGDGGEEDPFREMQSNRGRGSRESRTLSPFRFLAYDAVMALCLAMCKASYEEELFGATDLYSAFKMSEFNGSYGYVNIDPSTGSRNYWTITYGISNLVISPPDENNIVTVAVRQTDVYEGKKSQKDRAKTSEWRKIDDFIFHDGSTVPPPDLPPLEKAPTEEINMEADILGVILSAIMMLMSLGFGIWTWVNRRTKVIMASQPFFLTVVCCGSFIMAGAILPMTVNYRDSSNQHVLDVACMMTPWFFQLGFVTSFSALFSKMMRVNKLFRTKSHTRVTVGVRDVMKPFVVLLILTLSILISWTVVAPLTYQWIYDTTSTDEFGRFDKSFAICHPPEFKETAATAFAATLGAIDAFILFFANLQAYWARNISVEYSESRYIGMTMAILLEGLLIGVPILALTPYSPTPQFLVRSILIFIICGAIILPIFLPKVVFLKRWRKEKAEREEKKRLRLKRQEEFEARAREAESLPANLSGIESDPILESEDNCTKGLQIVDPRKDEPRNVTKSVTVELSNVKNDNVRLRQSIRNMKQEINHFRVSMEGHAVPQPILNYHKPL